MSKTITIYLDNKIDKREDWDVDVTAMIFWESEFASWQAPIERRVAAFISQSGVLALAEDFDVLVNVVVEHRSGGTHIKDKSRRNR